MLIKYFVGFKMYHNYATAWILHWFLVNCSYLHLYSIQNVIIFRPDTEIGRTTNETRTFLQILFIFNTSLFCHFFFLWAFCWGLRILIGIYQGRQLSKVHAHPKIRTSKPYKRIDASVLSIIIYRQKKSVLYYWNSSRHIDICKVLVISCNLTLRFAWTILLVFIRPN